FLQISSVIHYVVLFVFVGLFYKNFKSISTESSIKILMNNILKTRRIVQYYVWYNLVVMFVSIIFVWKNMIVYDASINIAFEESVKSGSELGFWVGICVVMVIMISLAIMI